MLVEFVCTASSRFCSAVCTVAPNATPVGTIIECVKPVPMFASATPTPRMSRMALSPKARSPASVSSSARSAESAALRSFVSVSRLAVVVSALDRSASSAPRTSLPSGMVAVAKFSRLAAAALTPSKARSSVSRAASAAVRRWTSVDMASERFSNASVAVGVLARWGLSKESVAAFSAMPSTPLSAVLRCASAAVRSFVSVSRLVVVVSALTRSASSAPRTSLPSGMVAVAKFSRLVASSPTPNKARRSVLSWVSAVVRALCSAAMPADEVFASSSMDCALAAMEAVCEDRAVPCACCSVSSVEIWLVCAATSDPVEPVVGCNAADSSLIVSSASGMSVPPRMSSMARALAAAASPFASMAVPFAAMLVVCAAMFVVCAAMFVVCAAIAPCADSTAVCSASI